MKRLRNILILTGALCMIFGVTAFAAIPDGTVVIGTKAYDLNYANNTANNDEIGNAVVNSTAVYVKMFDGSWINNNTNKTVEASSIPAVTYKDANGKTAYYKANDGDISQSNYLNVTSVE